MRIVCVSFLIGTCSIYWFSALPNLYCLAMVLLFIMILGFYCPYLPTIPMLAFSLGLLWVMIAANWQLDKRIPNDWQKKPLTMIGFIATLPKKHAHHTSFLFQTTSIAKKPQHYLLKLNWYLAPALLQVGNKWQLTVKLKKPHGFANPGGFDYEKYLFREGIGATGYVINNKNNRLMAAYDNHYWLARLRAYLSQKVKVALKNQALWGLIPALIVGDRREMTTKQWQTLQATGTAHLMAISGLHIGLIAGLIFYLVKRCWRLLPLLNLWLPAPLAASWAAMLTAIIYSMLAGFSLPTQRAAIMIMVALTAMILKRSTFAWQNLALGVLLIILLQPLAVLSISFWLSVSAIFVIFYGMDHSLLPRNKYRSLLKIQWVITVGLLPLSLLFFHKASLIAPLVNIIAIPWVGFIIVPASLLGCLALLGSCHLSQLLWLFALKNLQWLWLLLTTLSTWPIACWHHSLSLVTAFFAIIATLLCLAPKGFPGRYLGLFLLLPLLFPPHQKIKVNQAKFTLLDVGQGLASIVQTANHVLIYDTGPSFSPTFNAGQAVIIPFLNAQNIKKIDTVIISHGDNDHIGGVWSILRLMPVKKIITSVPWRFAANLATTCRQGQHWQWDGVTFQLLSPATIYHHCNNNCSCVLKVTAGKQSLLLTGDIEAPAEKILLKNQQALSAAILVAPHHGSKTSSTKPFIKAVQPQWVLFAVGYDNRFGFPSPIVVNRYHHLKVKTLSSARLGAITFILGKKPLKPHLYRKNHKTLWSSQ